MVFLITLVLCFKQGMFITCFSLPLVVLFHPIAFVFGLDPCGFNKRDLRYQPVRSKLALQESLLDLQGIPAFFCQMLLVPYPVHACRPQMHLQWQKESWDDE